LLEASEKYGKPFDPACLIETDLPYEILWELDQTFSLLTI
jgi:hypothetical protein